MCIHIAQGINRLATLEGSMPGFRSTKKEDGDYEIRIFCIYEKTKVRLMCMFWIRLYLFAVTKAAIQVVH